MATFVLAIVVLACLGDGLRATIPDWLRANVPNVLTDERAGRHGPLSRKVTKVMARGARNPPRKRLVMRARPPAVLRVMAMLGLPPAVLRVTMNFVTIAGIAAASHARGRLANSDAAALIGGMRRTLADYFLHVSNNRRRRKFGYCHRNTVIQSEESGIYTIYLQKFCS